MNILVTGANGFVGRNLIWNLKQIRDGKNRTRPGLDITEVYGYDIRSSREELEAACKNTDFVFHLAGVNRLSGKEGFMEGNVGFAGTLLDTLKAYHNGCPVMFSSSIQASLAGRFAHSEYGKSKLAGEQLFFQYGQETGAKVLVYRFPNLFGKWCRPNYNSVVATFCNAAANGLAYTVHNPETELELLYIDDLVEGMLDALEGKERHCEYPKDNGYSGLEAVERQEGVYCVVPASCFAKLGEIVRLLDSFKQMPETLFLPELADGSFEKKLYATYLSYLPPEKMAYSLHSNVDGRGAFTELVRTRHCGQVSVNITRPRATRGQHWHNSKWEIFIVVSGHGRIQQRRIGVDPDTGQRYPVVEFEVTGDQMMAVRMIPGYTHNIINLSDTQDLVTVIWANEGFDSSRPDTFSENVVPKGR